MEPSKQEIEIKELKEALVFQTKELAVKERIIRELEAKIKAIEEILIGKPGEKPSSERDIFQKNKDLI